MTSATDTRTDRQVDVRTPAGDTSGSVTLPGALFDASANVSLMHQVVVAQLAAARQGTHSTKTRGQVSGGGVKPYRQKGTGRARQGSIRAPQFAGGGTVFGPQPRDYTQKTPKKMKAAALRGALSDRAREDRVHVVSAFVEGDAPSTKAAIGLLVKGFASEVGRFGVRVNAIAPSIVDTALTATFKERPALYNLYAGHTVFNRWSHADEVATAVAYLASDAASYVSGSTLFVDVCGSVGATRM